ncbi:hypothetical protein F511_11172 [Dorcoceras hygrometricum]|uniref:Uncharacterized protein n=1 Tax=Dorcoceras hygrometricum TaxID=472368 RepID=A0A2Z7CAC6_9LAMI|nr:hypothetical protein F511_11172 [Dorcoceras hygrometricum]
MQNTTLCLDSTVINKNRAYPSLSSDTKNFRPRALLRVKPRKTIAEAYKNTTTDNTIPQAQGIPRLTAQTITAQSIHSKAHNPCSILSCKQAHIRTSILCATITTNKVRATQIHHLLSQHKHYSKTEAQKIAAGSYELHQRYPTFLTQQKALTSLKLQENVRKQYPNEASQQEESNATTLTLVGAVYRRQSKKIRSCNRSLSKPEQISTNSKDVAENHCRNWTRHPLLNAEQLTNICGQRNNRSLTQLTLTQLTAESSSLIQNAVVPTNPNDDPPPDDQSRPSGGSASRVSGSRGSGDGNSKSRADRGGSSKKRTFSSGGGGPYGPYKKDAEYWLLGKNQF